MRVTKKFDTVTTLSLLLKHRKVMFEVIADIDKNNGGAILQPAFVSLVAQYQATLSKEAAKEVGLVFALENLLSANVINDSKGTPQGTKLWFNTSIVEVFRLCKISLYRPLSKTSLRNALTSIWQTLDDIASVSLTTTPGNDDYKEWTADISHRFAELIGTIKANIHKLNALGESFKQQATEESFDITKEKYHAAAKIYQREIEPLTTFLDKDTNYKEGPGIYQSLERLSGLFSQNGDDEYYHLMISYKQTFLDLFTPIKQVADYVSTYLRKTKSAIIEHNAIDRALSIIRRAYKNTLSEDKRNKYIQVKDLRELGDSHPIHSIARLTVNRYERTPAFLNNVFAELSARTAVAQNEHERVVLEERNNNENAEKLKHAIKLKQWVDNHDWPENVDILAHAYTALKNEWGRVSLLDIVDVQNLLLDAKTFFIVATNETRSIEDDTHELNYRVRLLSLKHAN